MALDLSKLGTPSTSDTLVNPREIFAALPGKDKKFSGYLRDVQAEVLKQWFERRNSADLRLKMNTGGGKTVVGLLILKSCLNEGRSPAVYVAPTPYLASQVMLEAKALGLQVDQDPRSTAVLRGKSILVTHIHVLLNGKSKFGVGASGKQIPIGSLVLDDAHACLATAEQQYTATLDTSHPSYKALFGLFRADLEAQSATGVLDIEHTEPYKYMLVPFWAWANKINEVSAELHAHRDDDELKFVWPLLQEHLRFCRCVFGAGKVEISPRCLPVEMIPSFANAARRVFMSATFADDTVLVTDFDAKPDEIASAIAPESGSDIGDRMILVPQELDPSITDEQIRDLAVRRAKSFNVVVIVPSTYRAKFWSDVAAMTLTADKLEEGVATLQSRHVGLTVIVNKYDGIDLPNDACRLLILDGCPDLRRAIDRIQQSHLAGTELELSRSIQQIEQGMGRGVRASDDYCVVLLMGRSLTGSLFSSGGISRLTSATRAQFELSEKIGEQIRNRGILEIDKAIQYCLGRDADWMKAAKSALVHVKYETSSSDLKVAAARRQAFDLASHGDAASAIRALQDIVNECKDSYGDLMIRDRKMYVVPTPFWLADGVAHQQTLIGTASVYHTNMLGVARRTDNPWQGDLPTDAAIACHHKLIDTLKSEFGWDFTPPTTKVLMLTHRVLATQQGYSSLADVYSGFNDAFVKKEDSYVKYFAETIEPAFAAFESKHFGEMLNVVGGKRPAIETLATKQVWTTTMRQLATLRKTGTIGDAIAFLAQQPLIQLRVPDDIIRKERERERDGDKADESLVKIVDRWEAMRKRPYAELERMIDFIEDKTPFSTKHGVKGAEFDNVLVVIGRGWNRYNFNQYLEWAASPGSIPKDKRSTYERNRNLFYVACSRPRKHLALLFTQQLSAKALATLSDWFDGSNIHSLTP